MGGEHQQVLFVRQPEQFGAQQQAVVELEWRFDDFARVRGNARVALVRGQPGQVDRREVEVHALGHAQGLAIGTEVRAQHVMARDQLAQCGAYRVRIQAAMEVQRDRFVVGQRRIAAKAVGQPDLALRLRGRSNAGQATFGKRVVVDASVGRTRLVQTAVINPDRIHALTFMYFPGCSGLGKNHAGVPSGSRPMRAPGTTGLLASITVRGVALLRGRNSMSCISATDSLKAVAIFAMSSSLWAVVRKHGKLSRMWMPRLRISANSRSCNGWFSWKWVFQTEANCLTDTGAPASAQNALMSATMASVRALRSCCNAPPSRLKCSSTALAATSASG